MYPDILQLPTQIVVKTMKIILRKKKVKDGKQESLYLEFYKAYEKLPDGKLKHFMNKVDKLKQMHITTK